MTLSRETFAKALCGLAPEVSTARAKQFADEAFTAHPKIRHPDGGQLAAAVAERLATTKLEQLIPADLFLAQGALMGDAAAVSAFTQLSRQRVPRVLASMRPSAPLLEEVQERLEEKLLVSVDGKPGRLVDYQGTGTLAAWIGVAAVRVAIELTRLKRYQHAATIEEGSAGAGIAISDPELDLIRSSHSERFKEAFQVSLMELSVEDRSLLRMHLKDGLSIDQLGVMFQIHRATAARRVARAKQLLLEGIRDVLGSKFRLSPDEIESDLRGVAPNLDLSLSRLLLGSEKRR